MESHLKARHLIPALGLLVLFGVVDMVAVGVFGMPLAARVHAQSSAGSLSGYAWSDTPSGNPTGDRGAGWIHFSGGNYGVSIDASGHLSGYAWSENVGWISFNAVDVSGCPSGTCQAQLNLSTGVVSGWARALANNAAWDGWIHLAGSNYGVQVSGCNWSGYAWGGSVLGWIDFANNSGVIGTGSGCVQSGPTAEISANPASLISSGQTTLTWTSTGAISCTGSNFTVPGSAPGGVLTVTVPQTTIYGVTCRSASGSSVSANVVVTVTAPPPPPPATPSLTANPNIVSTGATTQLQWASANATSCSIDQGVGAVSPTSGGSLTSPAITAATAFTLSCVGLDGVTQTATAHVGVIPVFQEI